MVNVRNLRSIQLIIVLFSILSIPAFAVTNSEVREALVSITVRVDSIDTSGEVYTFGSGFFIAENGLVCTNFHVIEEYFRENLELQIQTNNGNRYSAKPLVWNVSRDWAVLQIPSLSSPAYAEFSDTVELLDTIWSAGYPITGNLKISQGTVSSYQPDFMGSGQNFYDVSMKFDGGNSGGPVINENLEVIGMVVAYYTEARDMDFIIPISEIMQELYWARLITSSSAFIPYEISGIMNWDTTIPSDDYFLTISNNTGYDLAYLYLLDDEMLALEDWGEDILGDYYLYDQDFMVIDPYEYPWIDNALQDVFSIITIIALDVDGDLYMKEFLPDLESWDIELTFDDFMLF